MHLALLRGINVGGKNKLPMKDLKQLFVEAGCTEVKTFIQSGNVIFEASSEIAEQLPTLISQNIAITFGFRAPVILRTAEQIQEVIHNNPFLKSRSTSNSVEDTLHIMFLEHLPNPAYVLALQPDRSPPDMFAVVGQEIYLNLPNGVANSKLTNAYFDSKLKTTSTSRNWRTVTALLKLMQS